MGTYRQSPHEEPPLVECAVKFSGERHPGSYQDKQVRVRGRTGLLSGGRTEQNEALEIFPQTLLEKGDERLPFAGR